MLYYFLYFGFEIGYFPSLDSSEIFAGILLFCVTAIVTAFEIAILVFVSYLYQNDDKNINLKAEIPIFYNSNFIYILMFISFAILAFAAFKLNYGWVAILSLLLLSYAGVNLAVFFKDRPNLIIYLLSLIMLLLFIFSAVILKNGGFWRFGCYFARLCSPLCWALRAPKRLRIFHLYFMPRSRL